jgi:anti-sigma B factor antagonist
LPNNIKSQKGENDMQIESTTKEGVLIITLLDKRLDAKLAVDFREAMDVFIKEGHHRIAFNMSGINFIDSSGLGSIVGCLKLMGSRGKFVLYGLTPAVLSMFKLTRMDRVFDIYQTEEQVLAALQI